MSPGQRTGPETLGWKQKLWGWRDGLAIKSLGFFSSGPELTPCIYMRQLITTPTAVPGSPWLPRAPALRRQQEMGLSPARAPQMDPISDKQLMKGNTRLQGVTGI